MLKEIQLSSSSLKFQQIIDYMKNVGRKEINAVSGH
jgi:hypothetical protein